MRGKPLELSSKEATIRNEGNKCGGERDWRQEISEMLFIVNPRIGHVGLRDVKEEEERER